MVEIPMTYKTGSGHLLSMTIFGQLFDRLEIPTYSTQHAIELCGKCKGVNGGCAIHAKHFSKLRTKVPNFYVVVVRLDMAWPIQYAAIGKSIKHSNYMRSGWADRLTMRLMWRLLKRLEKLDDNHFGLGAGNCPRCSRKKCTLNSDVPAPCALPLDRRYSIEATGVDCNALHNVMFGSDLPWWDYSEAMQHYMWRYGGVYATVNLDDELEIAVEGDKYHYPWFALEEDKDIPKVGMLNDMYIPER